MVQVTSYTVIMDNVNVRQTLYSIIISIVNKTFKQTRDQVWHLANKTATFAHIHTLMIYFKALAVSSIQFCSQCLTYYSNTRDVGLEITKQCS